MTMLEKVAQEVNSLKVGEHYPFPGFTNYRDYLAIDIAIQELPNKKFKYHIDFDYESAFIERIK